LPDITTIGSDERLIALQIPKAGLSEGASLDSLCEADFTFTIQNPWISEAKTLACSSSPRFIFTISIALLHSLSLQ
jgi:hypothetical protein